MTPQEALDLDQLEQGVQALGGEVLAELRTFRLSPLSKEYFSERLMEFGMTTEALKVNLFRFVDVLPSLVSSKAIIAHVQQYFGAVREEIPYILQKGLDISAHSWASSIIASAIRTQVQAVASRFIVGASPQQALKALRRIRQAGMAFTVDLLGETTLSESEGQKYVARYLELLDVLAKEVPQWPESAALVTKHLGEQTPINISVKLSALVPQIKPLAHQYYVLALAERLTQIALRAAELNAFLYVDMEDASITSITLDVFKQVFAHEKLRRYPRAGIVLQAYLRRTAEDLDSLIAWSQERGAPIGVRLVKGAYWDTETILAKQQGWPIPVWQEKENSDAAYERLTLKLLQSQPHVIPAFASHNVRSLAHACVAARMLGVPRTNFELQCLYGMGEPIKRAFAKRGYLVREYAPIGELLPGMAYLVRRLLENTSNEGFLRASQEQDQSDEELLRRPQMVANDCGTTHLPQSSSPKHSFHNEPLKDFTLAPVRDEAVAAVARLRQDLKTQPQVVQPIVAGIAHSCEHSLPSISPEKQNFVLANIHLASIPLAQKACDQLAQYFPAWRDTPYERRCEILFDTALKIREQKDQLIATITWETGKPLAEADADVAEAIDFLNYYALEAPQLFRAKKLGELPGELNSYFHEPRGVALIISPWNFPLAIPCGMFAAALVTGNCAILKPAEQSSLIALRLFQCFLQAGLPPEAATFLPGIGEEVGAFLATNPLIDTICFTGSKEVGLQLLECGAKRQTLGAHVRRVIAEMGGKNAIIVDEDADLDEAVKGVLSSAFGYAGQKCSACSRVFVLGSAYQPFLARLSEAVSSLIVGPATSPQTFVGPVIDAASRNRLLAAIQEARSHCSLLAQAEVPRACSGEGFYVPPTVFKDVPRDHFLWQRELFGPVLAVAQVDNLLETLQWANSSEYALTGGLYSRSPANIATVQREFRVGNLYINRPCTGALVWRQPFGGAKMSGVGSKAGGPEYLAQFTVPRAISENTIRRGFAP